MRSITTIFLALGAVMISSCGTCGESRHETVAREDSDQRCGSYVLVPARYETTTEQVCVSEPSVKKQQIEAQFQTVSDTVVDVPGHFVEHTTPAQYKDCTERVLVSPGHKEWKKVDCSAIELKPGEQRGDAYCLVDIPPVYENRTKSVLSCAACTKRDWVAPVYKTVERRVMVSAAREIESPVEARYETRTKQTLVSAAHWEWRWGTTCPADERDTSPRAKGSPPPPFAVGTPVSTTTAPAFNESDKPDDLQQDGRL